MNDFIELVIIRTTTTTTTRRLRIRIGPLSIVPAPALLQAIGNYSSLQYQ